MVKLAYCDVCKATFPLAIVSGDIGRGQKDKTKARVMTCPLGHTRIREVGKAPKRAK